MDYFEREMLMDLGRIGQNNFDAVPTPALTSAG
jgi:hypothetical protein